MEDDPCLIIVCLLLEIKRKKVIKLIMSIGCSLIKKNYSRYASGLIENSMKSTSTATTERFACQKLLLN